MSNERTQSPTSSGLCLMTSARFSTVMVPLPSRSRMRKAACKASSEVSMRPRRAAACHSVNSISPESSESSDAKMLSAQAFTSPMPSGGCFSKNCSISSREMTPLPSVSMLQKDSRIFCRRAPESCVATAMSAAFCSFVLWWKDRKAEAISWGSSTARAEGGSVPTVQGCSAASLALMRCSGSLLSSSFRRLRALGEMPAFGRTMLGRGKRAKSVTKMMMPVLQTSLADEKVPVRTSGAR
mmetsp:Transcript_105258/g.339530  ORF Transcript_105258/g.339530 Transcript_105258/m.339530 type:complete len:240 (+) Transcript_105258:200-919(+)